METLIAIILIIIMVILDTHSLDKVLNITSPLKHLFKKNVKDSFSNITNDLPLINGEISKESIIKSINTQTMWIYTDYENSLIDLCVTSAIKHSKDFYNIQIITKDDLANLIPEYMCVLDKCNSKYMKDNLIKYAILYKHGGVWIPSDTIFMKPLTYEPNFDNNHIITFSRNNENYMDAGISDKIIAVGKHNEIISQMLVYLRRNTLTFQNALIFKQSINKHFNKLLENCVNHSEHNTAILEKCNGEHYIIDDLFTTNIVKFKDGNQKETINLCIDTLSKLREFNYILNMSKSQIINSNLFISLLFKKAFV